MKQEIIIPIDMQNIIAGTISDFGQKLLGFIRNRISNPTDAEDILQEVWYSFSRMVDTEPIQATEAWLYRVARNKIIDRYRKHKTDSLEDLQSKENEEEAIFGEILIGDNSTPESEMMRQLFWEQLFEALEELPEEQRNVFIMNELEGVPFAEIAEATGEKVQTLISRKYYAVRHLRNRLMEIYKEIIEH